MEEWSHEKDQVMALKERVEEAKRIALQEIKVTGMFRVRRMGSQTTLPVWGDLTVDSSMILTDLL